MMTMHEVDIWGGTRGAALATPETLRDVRVYGDLLKRVVDWQRAKRRGGNHVVKGRSDVAASGRKIYRQKGTGGARHSARSANLFRGGGVTFGPVLRTHNTGLPKRVRFQGLCAALCDKLQANCLFQFDSNYQTPDLPRTRDARAALTKLGFTKLLFLAKPEHTASLLRGFGNIPYCSVLPYEAANVYDIMRHEFVVVDADLWTLLLERQVRLKSRRSTEPKSVEPTSDKDETSNASAPVKGAQV